ncbi:hypothetical protein HUG17_1416 [Dermatophagoides farinae]|uniref:CCHC-type domain-containing protein n=1 Tax=Dermatophagoides farinae TaxID=6954 RepID=A0A9D4SL28_DERFA|nr:hypothetical protein HUG17_1416 [Dermatophagoides farinae]
MLTIPDDVKQRLASARSNVSLLHVRRWDMARTELLRSELDELNQKLIELVGEEEIPEEELKKMGDYNKKLDLYMEHLKKMRIVVVRNQSNVQDDSGDHLRTSTPFNSIVNNFADTSSLNRCRPVKMDQLPTFDGKFAFWNAYKIMIEKLLINNTSLSEDLKKSMLLKTMKKDPEKFVTNLIGQRLSLAEIWSRVCVKFDDPQRAILEIKKDLESIPRIESENDVHDLKKTKDIVENANLAIKNLVSDVMFYTINLIQAVATRFYYKAQRHMLAKIKDFDQLVNYIDKLYDEALCYDYNKIRKDSPLKKQEPPMISNSTAAITTNCYICEKFHQNNFECLKNYDVKTVANLIKSKGLCFRCLKRGHLSKNCQMSSKLKCDKCPRLHATEMHEVIIELFQTKPKVIDESSPATEESMIGNAAAISVVDQSKNGFEIKKNSKSESRPLLYGSCNGIQSRMLFDYGSDVSLIDKELVKDKSNDSDKNCTVYSSSPLVGKEASRRKVSLERHKANLCNVNICTRPIIDLSENESDIYEPIIDLLNRQDNGDIDEPIIDLLNRQDNGDIDELIIEDDKIIDHSRNELFLKSDHELLNFEIENDLNVNDEDVDDDLKIVRKENGRYEARLPFLSDIRPANDFDKALIVWNKSFKQSENKSMKNEYEKQLLAYVDSDQTMVMDDPNGYLLPYHPIYRESASAPLCIVFNGSFGFDVSNQLLWKGHAHGLNIFDHLMKFRKGKFAVSADLSKAFLQMKVSTFGLVSSPVILTSVTKKLLCEQNFGTIAKSQIKQHHEMLLHDGIETTVPNLYHIEKKSVYYCKFCQIEKRKPVDQPFTQLPSTRTSFVALFEAVCIVLFDLLRYRNRKKFFESCLGYFFTAENEEDNDHEPEATTSTNRGRPIGSTNRKYTVCEERLKTLQNFELKILKPGNYLGLEFRQDKSKREIYVCQKSYILLKLKQFNLDNSKTMNTPISSTNDWYLESTTRETTIGTLVSLNGPIIWSSKRAKCIIDSTCEAEYIATSKCSKDIQWLLILMDYLRLNIPKPIIFNDNQAAIRQIHGEVVSQKLRHIDVKFHRIRSLLGKVDVEYIQSSQQLADILTKALSTQLHQNLIDKLFNVLVAE